MMHMRNNHVHHAVNNGFQQHELAMMCCQSPKMLQHEQLFIHSDRMITNSALQHTSGCKHTQSCKHVQPTNGTGLRSVEAPGGRKRRWKCIRFLAGMGKDTLRNTEKRFVSFTLFEEVGFVSMLCLGQDSMCEFLSRNKT